VSGALIAVTASCFAAEVVTPIVALVLGDWVYGVLLGARFALPRGRRWTIWLHHAARLAVGGFGLATGRIWLALAGALIPLCVLLLVRVAGFLIEKPHADTSRASEAAP
jgi:hypothetical protein